MDKPHQELIAAFKQHLIAAGKSKITVEQYANIVRSFLRHIGNERLDRISEELTRSFFAASVKVKTKRNYALIISQFLNFAVSQRPIVTARGEKSPRAVAPTKRELELREKWSLDKLLEQKSNADDLIAQLARKLIDHYVFFQGLLKNDDIDLDTVSRFADEARELIQNNLVLFMRLSAEGRNINSAIDERVQK
jgi:hypothetical protein